MSPVQQALLCVTLLCWSGYGLLRNAAWQAENDEIVDDAYALGFDGTARTMEVLAKVMTFCDCLTFVAAAIALAGIGARAVVA